MADVASSFKSWSTSAASNSPTSSTTIGSGLAPNLQQIQATIRAELGARSSSITASATVDIGSKDEGTVLVSHVSGTVGITSFGTVSAGIKKLITFSVSSGTLTLTYNATSMIIPSAANIIVADGDSLLAESLGSGNWKVHWYFRADGSPIGMALATTTNDSTLSSDSDSVAPSTKWGNSKYLIRLSSAISTSGSASYDFTSIPAGVKRLTINFVSVSTNGASNIIIQLGISSGVDATGYLGASARLDNGGSVIAVNYTTGFGIPYASATNSLHGSIVINLQSSSTNTWSCIGNISTSITGATATIAGTKSLAAVLDRVRITTVNGTDLFDAGSVSVSWEY